MESETPGPAHEPPEPTLPAAPTSAPPPLRLPGPWPGRVSGGVPRVELGELGEPVPQALQQAGQGDVLALRDEADRPLGFGLVDRESQCIRSLPAAEEETWGPDFFDRRVARAIALRQRLGLVTGESAYRLINEEGDGLSGFQADVYGSCAILHALGPGFDEPLDWLAASIGARLEPHSVIAKVRPVGTPPTGGIPYRTLYGEVPSQGLIALEDGVRYEIHPIGGLNTGLFCDARDVRRIVHGLVENRRVLNTFCYSGSFSVVAALGGARTVTSVDFSAGVLRWAKKNFELNDLDPESPKYRFTSSDVIDYLKRAKRRDRGYDVVILDPPATTAVPGRRWFLDSDYDRLIGHALQIMPAGGILIAMASSHRSRPEGIEKQIRTAARETGRRLRLLQALGQPPDFPTQMIWPQGRILKAYVLQVDN